VKLPPETQAKDFRKIREDAEHFALLSGILDWNKAMSFRVGRQNSEHRNIRRLPTELRRSSPPSTL
jgi:hypothetical protein